MKKILALLLTLALLFSLSACDGGGDAPPPPGTTLEEMMGWIEDLKGDGFEFQDFYDFGITEQDMLDMNGWWAYDGKTYLSVSFYEGTVTVEHTKELLDLESYFN